MNRPRLDRQRLALRLTEAFVGLVALLLHLTCGDVAYGLAVKLMAKYGNG